MAEKDKPLTFVEWVIVILASLGFAFDTYELLMLPLVLPPAIESLGGYKFGSPEFAMWRDLMFYMPAVCGGIFGLLGGYLTDRFGRRTVLAGSILLYAVSAGASAFATSLPVLLVLRCMTFVGVCVEFVAAVAWLAELFPEPKRRERILGITQAFSSLGGVMVTAFFTWVAKNGDSLPAIAGSHEPWRYTLMSGLIPALPLIILRPFLPESPVWMAKRKAGTLKRPSLAAIFAPALRQTTTISTVIFACSLGAAFGAIQQMPQIVPGLAEVSSLPRPQQQVIVGEVQFAQEMGGLTGRIALAGLALVHHLAPAAPAGVPDSRSHRGAARLLLCSRQLDLNHQDRDLPRRLLHRGPVEFLGQLSAAGLSHPPPGHGRELRGQRGWTADRNLCRGGDRSPGPVHAG